MNTPWGKSDSKKVYADGVTSYSTSSHGGFKLSSERNTKVHPAIRRDDGWYEEGCDWARVALTFPELFLPEDLEHARRTAVNFFPHGYMAAFGITVTPEESHFLRQEKFAQDTRAAGKLFVYSACTSWPDWHVPAGMVGVYAGPTPRRNDCTQRRFLIPRAEYKIPFSFNASDYQEVTNHEQRDENAQEEMMP